MPVEPVEIGRQLRRQPNRARAPTPNCRSIERSLSAGPRPRRVASRRHTAEHSLPMPYPASPAPPLRAAAALIATVEAASTPMARPRRSWARRDKFHYRVSSFRPVLIEQMLQRLGGIIRIERCPDRIRGAALQAIDSFLPREIGYQKPDDFELVISRQLLQRRHQFRKRHVGSPDVNFGFAAKCFQVVIGLALMDAY